MSSFRPTQYNEPLFEEILRQLIEGDTLTTILADPKMPSKYTFSHWLMNDPDLNKRYEMARMLQADYFADEAIDIADDGRNDYMERWNAHLQENELVINKEHVMRSELRIKTRKWLAAVYRPRRYGDKTQVEISGDPNRPVTVINKIEIVGPGEGSGLIEHKPAKANELPNFINKEPSLDFEN